MCVGGEGGVVSYTGNSGYSPLAVSSSSCPRYASYWWDSGQLGDLECTQTSGYTSPYQRFRIATWSGQDLGCRDRENYRNFPANPGFLRHHQTFPEVTPLT